MQKRVHYNWSFNKVSVHLGVPFTIFKQLRVGFLHAKKLTSDMYQECLNIINIPQETSHESVCFVRTYHQNMFNMIVLIN